MSDFSPDVRAQRIRTLFLEAADLPPAERAGFLDTACQGDFALREEIVSLLKHVDDTGELLDDLADNGIEEALDSLVGGGLTLGGLAKELEADVDKQSDPLVGQTVSHFTIVERVGVGGMGVVYKARDTRLEREVALKFLPLSVAADEEAKRRFVNEAKAASAIDHPNIGSVYEVGDTGDGRSFIAMAYYKGRTLKELLDHGPVPVEKALRIIKQVAEGLNVAHSKGLIHRDIKPANVMLAENGVVKILDFGIAKLSGTETMTQAGSTAGTATYMSPEQTRGESMDTRTDIWSLGVMLYELLSGKRPFQGDNIAATIHAIQQSDPAPIQTYCPDVDPAVSHLISGCLVKQADKRYQSLGEFLSDLELIKASDGSSNTISQKTNARKGKPILAIAIAACVAFGLGIVAWFSFSRTGVVADTIVDKSIAVLPLENLSPDPDDAYFADGIHEEILTNLANISDLRVIESTSVRQYRRTAKTSRQIGVELGAYHLLQGSVQRDQQRVAVAIRLIDAQTEGHLWGETYNRDLEDAISLRSVIARDVAEELHAIFSPEESARLAKRPTENQESYDLYLLSKVTDPPEKYALLERATRLDPDFYEAWDEWARSSAHDYRFYSRGDPELLEASRKALSELQRLEPESGRTLRRAGDLAYKTEDDLSKALDYAIKAKVLGVGGNEIGIRYLQMGKLEEARFHLLDAFKTDPLNSTRHNQIYWTCLHMELWDEATALLEEKEKRFGLDPSFLRSLQDYLRYGNLEEYIANRPEVHKLTDESTENVWKALANRDHVKAAEEISKRTTRWFHMLSDPNPNYDRGLFIGTKNLLAALNWFALGEKGEWLKEAALAKTRMESTIVQRGFSTPAGISMLAICYALEGNREKMETLIAQARERASAEGKRFRYQALCELHVAIAYIVLGDHEKAIDILEAASKLHSPLAVEREAAIWFVFDPLRGNPRFDAFIGEKAALSSIQSSYTKTEAASPSDDKSIAILPFENISGRDEDESTANGLHSVLLTQVSQIQDLKTIARPSVMNYRNTRMGLSEIAAELQVANLLTGDVQIVGEILRVNVQLTEPATSTVLWSGVYDSELTADNFFKVQSEITKAIADSLHSELSPQEKSRLSIVPTRNTDALKKFNEARQIVDYQLQSRRSEAISLLEQAIDLDSDFALAYAYLARAHMLIPPINERETGWKFDVYAEAEPLLDTALNLDPNLTDVYLAKAEAFHRGYKSRRSDSDFDDGLEASKQLLETALEINPNSAEAYLDYGELLIYGNNTNNTGGESSNERLALSWFQKAIELDPRNHTALRAIGRLHVELGEFDEARKQFRDSVEVSPSFHSGFIDLARLEYQLGRYDQAISFLRRAAALDPTRINPHLLLVSCYSNLGDKVEAFRWKKAGVGSGMSYGKDKLRARADYLAFEAFARGDFEEQARQLAIVVPEQPHFHVQRRILLDWDIRKGRFQIALERYQSLFPFMFVEDIEFKDRRIEDEGFQFSRYNQVSAAIEIAEILLHVEEHDRANYLLDQAWRIYQSNPVKTGWGTGNSTGIGIRLAVIHALRGEKEEALEVLSKAVAEGFRNRVELESSPLDSIRDESEFKELIAIVEADWARQLANVRLMEANGDLAPLPDEPRYDLETPASILIEN